MNHTPNISKCHSHKPSNVHTHTNTQIAFIDSIECRLLSASPIHFSFNNIRNICRSLCRTNGFVLTSTLWEYEQINNTIERWERGARMRKEMRSEKCGEKNEKRCDNATSILYSYPKEFPIQTTPYHIMYRHTRTRCAQNVHIEMFVRRPTDTQNGLDSVKRKMCRNNKKNIEFFFLIRILFSIPHNQLERSTFEYTPTTGSVF